MTSLLTTTTNNTRSTITINILAIHGKRQTGQIFENRINTLIKKFKRKYKVNNNGDDDDDDANISVKFEFIDAPYVLPLEKGDSVPTRTWFSDDDDGKDQGMKAVQIVQEKWNSSKIKYDGLFGFSQGSSLILLCCLKKDMFPGLKFIISNGGLIPDFANGIRPGSIKLPSLHIYGMNDIAVPPKLSILLSRCFSDPKIHAHPKNHQVCQTSKEINVIGNFIYNAVINHPKDIDIGQPFEINEDIEDEIEALNSIFAETNEYLLANDNPPVIKMKIVHNHTTNDNLLTITIVVQFILGPGYPEEMPCRIIILEDDDMYNINNDDKLQKLDGNQCKILQNILDKEALENIGMPMIYTLVECVKEWLETNENDLMIRDDTNKQTTNMHNKKNNTKASSTLLTDNNNNEEDIKKKTIENPILASLSENESLSSEAIILKMKDLTDNINLALKQARLLNNKDKYKSPNQKGLWNYCIGLVGKPSAGKSTFFNASINNETTKPAIIGAYPFTTIEPNFGLANIAIKQPNEGHVVVDNNNNNVKKSNNRTTNITIRIKDVAGLVPGAYVGRGKGNRFLNDLLDADVLIHVVDISGESDESGNIGNVGHDPMDDITWIHRELHLWIYFNVVHKWQAILRRPDKFVDMFAGYHATPDFIHEALNRCGIDVQDIKEVISQWKPLDLHQIVAHFIELRFPIFLCLNKIDKSSSSNTTSNRNNMVKKNINNVANEFSNTRYHPVSAKDGKGIKECLKKAMSLRFPYMVFPVKELNKDLLGLVSKAKFGDCLPFKHGSCIEDIYTYLAREQVLYGEFVRAEILTNISKKESKLAKKTETLSEILESTNNIVVKISTNKRKQWQ